MPGPDKRASRTPRAGLDLLAGVAGLLGGSMLLSRYRGRQAVLAGQEAGDAEIDLSARQGRGERSTPPSRESRQRGHETQDADAASVARILLLLGGIAAASVMGLLLVLALFHRELSAERPVYTGEQSAHLEPPRPQLEAHPDTDLHRQNAGEQALLDGYGWVDAAHTRARIPIARAMALTVGRPLDAAP